MLLAGLEPDHVAGSDLLDLASLALYPTTARRHDERLTEGVGVPSGPGAGLERDAGAEAPRRCRRVEQRVYADPTGEPVGRTLGGWAGTDSLDFYAAS